MGAYVVAPALWLVALVLLRHRPRRLLAAASLPLAYFATSWVWKPLWARPRPPTALAESWAYPSGHTTAGFALSAAWVLALGRRGWWAAALVAGATGLARILAGEHWLTDVLGAMLWASAYVVAADGLTDVAASRTPRSSPP